MEQFIERGVVVSETSRNTRPEIGGSVAKFSTTGNSGTFTVEATGLLPATNYTFAAYLTTTDGTVYSPYSTVDTNISSLAWDANTGNVTNTGSQV
ncbi:MAG: hypothetical protein NTW03_18825, partial [Verrucomicrobia bacterium]|nr:hypothetical protein [Verrucomicrobiota bacterium]